MEYDKKYDEKYHEERNEIKKMCKEFNDEAKEIKSRSRYKVQNTCNCIIGIRDILYPYATYCAEPSAFCNEDHNRYY